MVFHVEEVSSRRKAIEAAVKLALESRWEEAAEANQSYLKTYPNDTEGLNRLGKALMELGRYDEAREAYQKSYDLDHVANVIAKKNLQRLEGLSQSTTPRPEGSPRIAAQLFIEETGKTGVGTLLDVNDGVLKLLTPGDSVELRVEGKSLQTVDANGEVIGIVDPRMALRLLPLMETGNSYAAALHSVDGDVARVVIKETFQSEANVGKPSFAASAVENVRAYTRDSLVRADDEDDEAVEETGDEWADTDAPEADEEEGYVEAESRVADNPMDGEFEE
ncbi:MAG: tetratricopeptide repeat protein [Dehalococcoidia bacterium]|nr:tetratricopeptide repeat protein [Dehalococcoidia bacterium]